MPMTEKEYNGILLDQISLLDRLERVAKKVECKEILEEIEFERKHIERKLYQKPPIIENN